ncbi:hypothetical protein S83_035409, partial [Arachis hypogaea]
VSYDPSRSCFLYIASSPHIYNLQVPSLHFSFQNDELVSITWHLVDYCLIDNQSCPHHSEIQSIVLANTK